MQETLYYLEMTTVVLPVQGWSWAVCTGAGKLQGKAGESTREGAGDPCAKKQLTVSTVEQ